MRQYVFGLLAMFFGASAGAQVAAVPFTLYCFIDLGGGHPMLQEFLINEAAQTVGAYSAQINSIQIAWQTPANPTSYSYLISRLSGEIKMAPTVLGDKPVIFTGTCSKTNPRKF